jgi:uncharacterized protein (DUF697 family)
MTGVDVRRSGRHGQAVPGAVVEVLDVDTLDVIQSERLRVANSIVRTHVLLAAGAGFLPGHGLDVAALSLAQMGQLQRLSRLYHIDFSDDLARKLVAVLLGGIVPLRMATSTASVLKMVPLLGQLAGSLSMAGLGGAVTYAIGQVFIQHFESGGTFLTFDVQQVRAYFEFQTRQRLRVTRIPDHPARAA